MEKNGYKFNKISINYFVALCHTVTYRKEGLKSYALPKIELEQNRKEENKKGSIIKKVGVHQYLLSRQLYWTLPQDKALAPLLDKSSFSLSSLGEKEKAFESSKEKRSLIDKPFFIEKGNIKESFIDFFPYRKSFLCYWLLPFVGFAAVNVNVNKKDYFTGRTFEAPFVLNWAQKGLEDSGKAVTSLGEVSYNSKGKNKMEKENNIKEHCILYLQSLENYVMDWEALTSQKKGNNNLGFRESLLYPLGKKEVTKRASLWSSSYINLNLFKKEQKSNVSLFKGESALTCSPIKREEIKESEKANKQTGSWFGSSAFAFSKASMEGKEKVNLIKGGVFLPYEEKKMNIKGIYNKKENPVSSFMKTSSILHNFRKKELLKGNLFKDLPTMTVSNGKEYLLPKGIMNWKQLILSSFSSEGSVSEAVKNGSKAAIDNSYTYNSLGKQKLYKLLIDSLNRTFASPPCEVKNSPLTLPTKGQVAKQGLEAGNNSFKFNSKSSFEKNLSLEKEEVNKVYLSHTKMWVNNPLLLTSTSTSTSYINNKEVEGEAAFKQSVNKIANKKTENKYLFNTTNVLSLSNANVNANEKDLNKLKEKNYLTNYGAFVKKYTLKIKNLLLVNEFKKSFSPIGKERMENVNLKEPSHLHSSTSPLWNAYNKGNVNLNEHKKIEKLLRAYFSIKNKSIMNNERKTPKFLLLKDGALQKRKRYEFYKRVNNGMKKWFDKETQSSRNLLLADLTQDKRKGKFFNLSPYAAKVNYTPRLLIGNRSFILFSSLAPTSNLDLNLKGVLRNESPLLTKKEMDLTLSKVNSSYNELLDKETNIEKERKSIMKKRRRKKLKKETRRRKKRKRFYPRPVWLRYRLYLKFIKRRSTSQTKVGNKALNNSKVNMNINIKEKELNLRQSIYRKYNKGLPTGYSEVNTNVLFPSGTLGKNYFTISRPVLGDLKRLLWKSYWLRSNLNPYLKRVKSYLTNMKQCTQKMEYIYNFKNIYTFLGGFVPNLASLKKPALPYGRRGFFNEHDSVSTKMQTNTNTNISTGKNKWENSLYFAEYNRITYLRIQELIYGIRENFATFNNNNKFVKARTSHLSHRKMQDNKREDVFSKRKTTDFWVKLGKAIMAENQSLLKESLLKKNKEWWLFGNKNYINEPTISQLRMLWALSKTSPSLHLESSSSDSLIGRDLNNKINKNYNSFLYKRKGIWVETGKMREQLKYNKTKKMYRDIKRKLQTLLNEQYEIVKSFDFNGVSINNKKIKSLLEKRCQNLETDLFNNTLYFSKDELFKNALKKTRQKEEKFEFLIGRKKRFINSSLEPQNLHQYKKLLSLANSNSISNFNSNFDKKNSILLTREPWLNTLTSKSSYWWINENATSSPIYRILFGNIFGSIEDRDLQYVDKSNSSNFHFFFNGKWDAASTSLLYGKNENKNILWISTLLFHFCTILSLISISQIRDVLKFYLLGISKVYKASLSSSGILTYSYTSFLRLKANYNYNISSSQKPKKYKSSSLEKFSFSANAKRKKINKFYYSSLINKSNSSSPLSLQSPQKESGAQKLTSDSSLLSLSRKGENEKEKGNIKDINKKLLLALQLLSTEKQKESSIPISFSSSSSSNKESGEVLKLNVKNLKNKNVVLVQLVKMLRSLIKNPILLLKSMDVNKKEKLPYLNKYAVLYSFVAVNLLLSNSYNLYWNSKKLLKQTFDVLGRFGPKSLFNFLEKPGEQIIDWIAYMFLVEWASDMTNTIPENVDIYLGNSFYKMTRQIYSFNLYLYLWQNWGIKNTYTSNAIGAGTAITPIYGVAYPFPLGTKTLPPFPFRGGLVAKQGEEEAVLKSPFLFETNNFSILNLATPFIQRRIYHLYEILLFQFYQPDTDLIVRQRKGVLFWDIWGDFLMGVAEDSNINISELTSLKEEQIKLLEKSTELISNENNSPFSTTSFAFTKAKARILKKDSLKKGYDVKLLNKGKSNLSNSREGNKGLLQMNSIENNNFAAQQFLSYQGKDTELFIDLHPPKSFSTFSLLKKNESVGTSVGSLVCQIFAGIMSKQISKNILIIGSNSRTIGSGGSKSPYSNLLSATEGIESSISGNLEGREKTLLIQAIAGETELKIITDNAYRYAMVYRGVAVGIKLLRDVFDSLSLHTPCLFLIEDIHAIGERRPLLISDDEKGASPNGKQIFGSQREEIHEKNQVLYQLSKHVITHYGKPYKGDFSLLIPTNHYCFDLFRNHNLRFLNARQNTLSFNSPKIPVQSNETDTSSSSYSSGKEKRELEKNKTISLSTLFSTFADSSINKYTSNINILGGEGTGDKQENSMYASRLLFKSSQLFSPPATSPFSVLNLKEEKKFKPHKIVSEMPWGGLPGEQLASVSKASYSIRVKVAMLADMAISTLSVKLDMITDLLVIIDSVKGNRGFVVFATTHVPYILDPALRRPGRLDETITLGIFPNLLSRWDIFKSSFSLFTAGKQQTGFYNGISMDLTYSINSPLRILNKQTLNYKNSFLKYKYGLYPTTKLLLNTQPFNFGQSKNKLTTNKEKNELLQTTLSLRLNKQDGNYKKRYLQKILSQTYFIASNMLYEAYTNSCLPLTSAACKVNKNHSLKQHIQPVNFIDYLQPLNMETSSLYMSLYASPLQFKNEIVKLMSGKLGEMLLFSSSVSFGDSNLLSLLDKNIEVGERGKETIQYQSQCQWNEVMPTSLGLSNTWKVLSSLILSFVQKRFLLLSNSNNNLNGKESIINNNLIVPKFLFFNNQNSLYEPPSPPSSNILLPARRYENYRRSFAYFSGKKTSIGIMEKIATHQQQRLVKKLYGFSVKESFKSEIIENRFTSFTNATLMIGSFSSVLQKPSHSNWFVKNRILMRHKDYLTNQWWNGQLPEHNAETTFLSDIDWRYSFIESIGDLLLDFPDADQHYNPKNRRWLLTKGDYHNWFDFEKTLYSEIYTHFIFNSFVKAYHIYEKNREILDFYSFYVLRKGLYNTLNEFETIKLYKRFFCK
jgi:SpoVK/Ycf46/Vps4 family AAA+-type ATPase